MTTPTVTLRYSQALLQAAAQLGIPPPADAPVDERVPLAAQDALWETLCQRSDDPLIGLRLGQALQVGHLDVAGMLLMSCETFGEALDTLVDYLPIIGEGARTQLRGTDEHTLEYTPEFQVRRAERIEAVLSGILQLSRWSTGGQFAARRIDLRHAPLDRPERYPDLLGCPVHFEQAANGLVFDASALKLPLIQANAGLRDELRVIADRRLAELDRHGFSRQICALIRKAPQASRDAIAARMHISGRHLNRRLAEDGLSFKQLRDRELQQLAAQALRAGDKTAAIASELGFSDESAFAKAFRRWTGQSPGQFRDWVQEPRP